MYPYLAIFYASLIIKDPEGWKGKESQIPAMIRDDVMKLVDEMAKKEVPAE